MPREMIRSSYRGDVKDALSRYGNFSQIEGTTRLDRYLCISTECDKTTFLRVSVSQGEGDIKRLFIQCEGDDAERVTGAMREFFEYTGLQREEIPQAERDMLEQF